MIYQVIDPADDRLRLWTGSAISAIRHQAARVRSGSRASVADYKGRRLSLSDLYECARKENERQASASLAGFRRLMEARED